MSSNIQHLLLLYGPGLFHAQNLTFTFLQVYKEGKKISEHIAQETGTGSFQKVTLCH